MSANHATHILHGAHKVIEDRPPLDEYKNPLLAALVGFLFGPIGIGVYFRRFKDFLYCLIFLIFLMIVVPGLGLIPGWLFSAAYGFFRAQKSNEKRGEG